MDLRTLTIITGLSLLTCFMLPAGAVHIPTVSEGLLSIPGCYAGAYLGGNFGTLGPNDFHNSNTDGHLYETQFLDHPDSFGETDEGGLNSIDTGIMTFRNATDALVNGSGAKQVIFSRYYAMDFYPDNDYGKVRFTKSPGPDVWAEAVIMNGGVPMIALAPYNGKALSLDNTYANGQTGRQILTDLSTKLKAVSDRHKDSSGKGATILIWLAPEFNAHNEVDPEMNDSIDSPAKQTFRQWFRDAYNLIHQRGGDNVQVVWAGTVAPTKDARQVYWPGNDANLKQLPADSVDWVGMTWYSYEAGPTKLSDIKGFYDYYATAQKHPFIFTETSSDGQGNPVNEEALKEAHIKELYNPGLLASMYPDIKGIVWFNVIKKESRSGNDPTLVMKDFLIPDGQYEDNGINAPGLIYSASDPTKQYKMISLYPISVMDPYFLPAIPEQSGVISGQVSGPAFQANFTVSPTNGAAPLTVKCTDKSIGKPGIFIYNFGDGTNATGPNPVHTYRFPGVYTISLSVMKYNATTNTMMSSVATKPGIITVAGNQFVPPVANFSAMPVDGTVPLTVKFTDQSPGSPTYFNYDFGDGFNATGPNPSHTYTFPGVYTVTMTVMKNDVRNGSMVSGAAVRKGLISARSVNNTWKFVVFGDSPDSTPASATGISPNLSMIATAIAAEHPDLAVYTGDLISGWDLENTSPVYGNYMEQFENWMAAVSPIHNYQTGSGIPLYAMRGNHENGPPGNVSPILTAYKDTVAAGLPTNGPAGEAQLTYSVAYRDARFIINDEYIPHNGLEETVNQDWVDAQLAGGTQQFTFVFGHSPAYRVDDDILEAPDSLFRHPEQRDIFWQSLVDNNVSAYMCGHAHMYVRGEFHGVPQIISGNAGAPMEAFNESEVDPVLDLKYPLYNISKSNQKFGYLLITVNDAAGTWSGVQKEYDPGTGTWITGDRFTLPAKSSS